MRALVVVMFVAATAPAYAQGDEELTATQFDPSTCKRRKPTTTKTEDVDISKVAIAVNWKEFEITGDFVDSAATVRDLLAPTMDRNHTLTPDARREIIATAARFGYHVVGLGTRETPAGTNAHLHLAPLPMVRKVDVDVDQSIRVTLFRDEVRRRLRVRPGAYLPWTPNDRNCLLVEEKRRIEEFLHDEGYFDATVDIQQSLDGIGVHLAVAVDLGSEYTVDVDQIEVLDPDGKPARNLPVGLGDIRDEFRIKRGSCLIPVVDRLCIGSARFTRAKHQASVAEVVKLFQTKGYPAVRVRSSFDPGLSPDRLRRRVDFDITIDPRRKVDPIFEGNFTASVATMREKLTFDDAANADAVEAAESARAITTYLQSRGYFDAKVTWRAEPFADEGLWIMFRIEQGRKRRVKGVQFVGNTAKFAKTDTLEELIATKRVLLSTTLLGSITYPTSELLASDVRRIDTFYKRNGYLDARVRVSASPDPAALDSAALTAAILGIDRGSDLYVRFTIEEGQPTLLSQVQVELGKNGDQIEGKDQQALCTQVLKDLAEFYARPELAKQTVPDRCVAEVDQKTSQLAYRDDDVLTTKDRLKDRLFARGRPRAEVKYEAAVLGPRRISVHYTLDKTQELRVGKVVIRGNFRTRDSVIRDQLKLREGVTLTTEALGESIRRLRSTGLFNAVNIDMPDLEATSAGSVNAVVEVVERYDHKAQIDLELGYSSFNGTFVKILPSLKNLFGTGVALDLNGTIGFDLGELLDTGDVILRQLAAEATLRFPQFLTRNLPIEFETELTGFHRRQDTPRFGILRTTGATLGFARTFERQRDATHSARAITFGLHYDFRSRERNVDVLRPIGADDDDSQVPITTRTSSVGVSFEWEQRVDRSGNLSPLAPEGGFRLEAQLSYAEPILFGQDSFAKASLAGSRFQLVGQNLVLRIDGRYDQGFPLGGAALLPEVERFFGGGDSTVRGYNDDRLATEIVQVGVPPLDHITQIRILPAGGNIRVLGSADAQLRIYKILSSALFADAGLITNQWSTVTKDDIRPSLGMALIRLVTPFGAFAFERAVPLRPRLGDDPRGRWHISFAARAQF